MKCVQIMCTEVSENNELNLIIYMITLYVYIMYLLYRLGGWFSCLNGLTLVIFGALYSLLFDVSHLMIHV